MSASVIEDMVSHAAAMNPEQVRPGLPYRVSEATSVGEGVWQGDLGLEIVAAVPAAYQLAPQTDAARQLVPGSTQGARHCLDSLDGVALYHPAGWGPTYDGLAGPCFVLSQERAITHPVHGQITIPAGFTVLCRYQREYDAEQRRERRNAD